MKSANGYWHIDLDLSCPYCDESIFEGEEGTEDLPDLESGTFKVRCAECNKTFWAKMHVSF